MSIASLSPNFSLVHIFESVVRAYPDKLGHVFLIGSLITGKTSRIVASTFHYVDSLEHTLETTLTGWLTWIWPHVTRGTGDGLAEGHEDGWRTSRHWHNLQLDAAIQPCIVTVEPHPNDLPFSDPLATCNSPSSESQQFQRDCHEEIYWPTSVAAVVSPLPLPFEVFSRSPSVVLNANSRIQPERMYDSERTWHSVALSSFVTLALDVSLLDNYVWMNWILFIVAWYLIYCAMSRLPFFSGDSDILDGPLSPVTDKFSIVTLPPYMLLDDDNLSKHSLAFDLSPKAALRKLRTMSSMDTFAPVISTPIISDTTSMKRMKPLRKSAIESLLDRLLITNGRITTTKRQSHSLPVVDATPMGSHFSDDEDTPTQSPRTPKPEARHLSWLNHSDSSPQYSPADDEEDDELTPKATDHIPSSLIHPLGDTSVASSQEHQRGKNNTSVIDRIQQAIDMRMQAIRAVQTRKQARSTNVLLAALDVPPSISPPTPPFRSADRSLAPVAPSFDCCKTTETDSKNHGLSASMWARDSLSETEDEGIVIYTDPESMNGHIRNGRSLDSVESYTAHPLPSSGSHSRSHSDTIIAQASDREGQEEGYTSCPQTTPRRCTLPNKLTSQADDSETDGCGQPNPHPVSSKPLQLLRRSQKHERTRSEGDASIHIPAYTALRPMLQHALGYGSVAEKESEVHEVEGQDLSRPREAKRREFSIPPFVVSPGHTTSETVSPQVSTQKRFDTRFSPLVATFHQSISSSRPFLRVRSHSFTAPTYSSTRIDTPMTPLFDIPQYIREQELAQSIEPLHSQALTGHGRRSWLAVSEPMPSSPTYSDLEHVTATELPSFDFPSIASPLIAFNDCATPPQQFSPVVTSSPQIHEPSTSHERFLSPGYHVQQTSAPPPSPSEYGARALSGGVYLGLQGRRSFSFEAPAWQEVSRYETKIPPSTPLALLSVNPVAKLPPAIDTSSHTRISTIDWATDEPEPVEQRKKHTRGKRGGKRTKKRTPVGEVNWALA